MTIKSSKMLHFFFLQEMFCLALSVVGNVPVDSEAPEVTSLISRFAGPTWFFEGAHRGSVCACVYRGECALMCERLCSRKNK